MACLVLGATLALHVMPGGLRLAEAQQQRPAIVVPAVVKAQPASKTPLPIRIAPPEAPAKNSFVRIRGLPISAALTEGHAIAPGAWAVPLNALPNLNVILPVGIEGSSDISIHLVAMEGTVLAEARMTLAVDAPPAQPAGRAETPTAPAKERAAAPSLPPQERERALAMHTKGLEQLDQGNVYAARKFFERAAAIGLAQSAVALGATYDPDELARMQVVGLEADPAAARKWYEKARELGAPEAPDRLRRLGAAH